MIKKDIVQLHEDIVQIREGLDTEVANSGLFSEYEEFGVTPDRTHCSKEEHKKAIFMLGEAIASSISNDEFSEAGKLKTRMNELKSEL